MDAETAKTLVRNGRRLGLASIFVEQGVFSTAIFGGGEGAGEQSGTWDTPGLSIFTVITTFNRSGVGGKGDLEHAIEGDCPCSVPHCNFCSFF